MSITNIICNGEITLVQGVNGLFLCEESIYGLVVGMAVMALSLLMLG